MKSKINLFDYNLIKNQSKRFISKQKRLFILKSPSYNSERMPNRDKSILDLTEVRVGRSSPIVRI